MGVVMDKPERLHRPDPARTEPVRDFMTYVRTAGIGGAAPAGADVGSPASRGTASGGSTSGGATAKPAPTEVDETEHAIAHGVKLGYAVIDEQIRQGEKLADRLRQVAGKPGAMPAMEVGTLIERALNVYKDMGGLAVAAVETLVRNPMLQSTLTRTWQGSTAPETAPAQGGSSNFGFELASNRRTQVRLDIRPKPGVFLPVVYALHASSPTLPPLTGVRFQLDAATATPVLHIDISDVQPAGNYMGVVVDSVTDEPCGTISVRVLPGPA
jgi:hypothetical protein